MDEESGIGMIDYKRLYEFRFRGVDQSARQRVWDVVAKDIFRRMSRPMTILDPAGGRGEFINAISAEERWVIDRVDIQDSNTTPT